MGVVASENDAVVMPRVLAYYQRAADAIVAVIGGGPLVYRNYPAGFDHDGHFGLTSFPMTAKRLLWAVHAKFAIEFYTWAGVPDDLQRLRFARVLLEPPPGVTFDRVRAAAHAVRAVLREGAGFDAVPVLDGGAGIALWIPLADTPPAADVRVWLHRVANDAATGSPDLLSTAPNTHHDGRVHVHVASNAAYRFSVAPYSLRAPALSVATPVAWDELDGFAGGDAVGDAAMLERFASRGDVFAAAVAAMGAQRLGDVPAGNGAAAMAATPGPRGHIITAALAVLDDGTARTSTEILEAALARGLVPRNTTAHYVYTALFEYIGRLLGRGRKPPIVQDAQRRFRINEPSDDWPDLEPGPPDADDVPALCDRLVATASGEDPAAFETAVCDAFGRLGFATQHLGGHAQPDGIADAVLGALGYRVLLECKTAKTVVTQPDAAEAGKFRDAFAADLCVLVGPDFTNELELLAELQTHRVTALSVDVVQTLLHLGADALEVQRLLVPGFASDSIGDLVWERRHGAGKRVATVAALVQREGWKAQVTAAQQGGPVNAPRLTVDAAMLLVDAALRAAGAATACTRADVEAAFTALAAPAARLALRDGDALVVLQPPDAG